MYIQYTNTVYTNMCIYIYIYPMFRITWSRITMSIDDFARISAK